MNDGVNDIDRLLASLADAESRVDAPRRLEDAVMTAWDEHQARRPRSPRAVRAPRWLMPLAAGVLFAIGFGVQQAMHAITGTALPALPTAPQLATATPRLGGPAEAVDGPAKAVDGPAKAVDGPAKAGHYGRETASDDRRSSPSIAAPPATVVLVGEPIRADEGIRVVRMRVPRSALSMMGIRSVAAPRSDSVDLDVLVGEDGVARAVRVGM